MSDETNQRLDAIEIKLDMVLEILANAAKSLDQAKAFLPAISSMMGPRG